MRPAFYLLSICARLASPWANTGPIAEAAGREACPHRMLAPVFPREYLALKRLSRLGAVGILEQRVMGVGRHEGQTGAGKRPARGALGAFHLSRVL